MAKTTVKRISFQIRKASNRWLLVIRAWEVQSKKEIFFDKFDFATKEAATAFESEVKKELQSTAQRWEKLSC